MNYLNEKIRILKIQIEAEKRKKLPNWELIENLSNELNDCLEQVM